MRPIKRWKDSIAKDIKEVDNGIYIYWDNDENSKKLKDMEKIGGSVQKAFKAKH